MTNQKHKSTPGPWTIDSDIASTYAPWADIHSENDNTLVACLGTEGISRDALAANARLIAAAPDLLESLKLLIDMAEPLVLEGEPQFGQEAIRRFRLAKRAIAKAEGGE